MSLKAVGKSRQAVSLCINISYSKKHLEGPKDRGSHDELVNISVQLVLADIQNATKAGIIDGFSFA